MPKATVSIRELQQNLKKVIPRASVSARTGERLLTFLQGSSRPLAPARVYVRGMNKRVVAIVLAATLTMAGCATVVNGRQQNVLVVSEPSGADVLLNGESVGTTPANVLMRRRGRAELQLQKPGYATEMVSVSRRTSGWVAGNLLWFNPLAAQGMDSVSQWLVSATAWFAAVLTVDLLSGGVYVRPPVVTVTLTPLPQ